MDFKNFDILFGQLSQPVIGVNEKGERFFNSSAKSFFGVTNDNLDSQKIPTDIKNQEFSPNKAFTGEILGKYVSYSGARLDDILILYINSYVEDIDSLKITRKMINSLRSSAMSIKLSADQLLLKENKDKEKRKKYESAFYHSYYSLNKIITNVDNADLVKTEKLPFNPSAINLTELCSDLIDTTSLLFKDRNIQFVFDTKESNIVTFADNEKIEKLLLCLLSNSIRHCISGSRIVLGLSKTDKAVVITLTDNGVVMKNDELRSLFTLPCSEQYTDQKNFNDELGMYIAMGITKLHKGTMLVETKKGEGNKYVVSLPYNNLTQTIHSPSSCYGTRNIAPVLTEFSDLLNMDAYGRELED